ncbi:MAG TPA: hypothetical protein VFS19_07345 [Planctomycetota bacterium]|nr:hypothetical protein [Planctomycetota bacterium]
MTLILAALVLLQAPTVREELLRLSMPGCGHGTEDRVRRLVQISDAALEELPAMIKESGWERRDGLLSLYRLIAHLRAVPRTPAVILNLARSGHLAAAQVVLTIRDKRSIDFTLECLDRMAADEQTASFTLERAILEAAGRSRSEEVGKRLLALIDVPHMRKLVIEPLGTLAYAPAADKLRELTRVQDKSIATAANFALSKIVVPATAEALVARVRSKWMSGEFSWYEWALERIVDLNLKEAAPALREEHDEFVRKFGAAQGIGWSSEVLFAIHRLGGKLAPEETKLLADFGRLEPAKLSEAGEEKLVEGFDKSVWAPRAQRLKEQEAKNARPPRLTEDQLPRFMKERIVFVMNLEPPDPLYLAPDAALALQTIEEMLTNQVNERDCDKLLAAYLYLARLREGMKTPVVIYRMASLHPLAAAIVTTIADDKAEAWYLEALKGRNALNTLMSPGRLSSDNVKAALLKWFREGGRLSERMAALRALADLGCVEILPELETLKENPMEIREAKWRLEIFASPKRDELLLTYAKSMARSTNFSYSEWGLAQIVRLNLKHLAPELRAWYDVAQMKWVSWTPMRGKVLHALVKFGAPISPAEEEILKKSGRSIPPAR